MVVVVFMNVDVDERIRIMERNVLAGRRGTRLRYPSYSNNIYVVKWDLVTQSPQQFT